MLQGFVYVLDCEGRTVEGWPLQMGEVLAQVAVADINADGALELVAADVRGNVVALSADGTELWERHVPSLVGQVCLRLSLLLHTSCSSVWVLQYACATNHRSSWVDGNHSA